MELAVRVAARKQKPVRPGSVHARKRRWRPAFLTWSIAMIAILGVGALLYPSASQWLTSKNQSHLVQGYEAAVQETEPGAAEQLAQAREYNGALTAGVQLDANAPIATGTGQSSAPYLDYDHILDFDSRGVMARLRYSAAGIDLPVFHGTSEETLLQGVGHLEGAHLPVGGESTHAVLTGHRGLAQATMFNHLDRATVGDTFSVEVAEQVLTYRVREIQVVQPEQTETLRITPGEDLLTLITCTPLGINSHRILVTGERVTPTPIAGVEAAGEASDIPGFPWWIVMFGAATVGVSVFVWRAGYSDARRA